MPIGHRFYGARPSEPIRTRSAELLQLNFDGSGARDLQMANLTLTDFGREDVTGRTLNLGTKGGKKGFPLLLVIVGVGAAVYLIADDDDDEIDLETNASFAT